MKIRSTYLVRIVSAVAITSLFLSGVAHATPAVHVITSCADLQQIDADASTYTDTFVLGNDIDCNGQVLTTLGWGNGSFEGTFDGQGHSITNLQVDPYYSDGGLFADTLGATIKNLTIVSGTILGGGGYMGALIGQAIDTNIDNVHSNVDVSGSGEAGGLVGDFVAQNANASITRSSATGTVNGAYGVGGLVGHSIATDHVITISQSYATGYVTGGANNTGGLVGLSESDANTAPASTNLQDDYSQSSSDGGGNYDSGGLIGAYQASSDGIDPANLTIARAYANGGVDGSAYTGGLIGDVGQIPVNSTVTLTDVFAAAPVGSADLPHSGAIIGHQDISGAGGAITASGVYYDQSQTVLTTCAGTASTELTSCHPENVGGINPNYFLGNHTSAPLNNWNFTAIWQVSPGGYPVFRATPLNGQDDSDGIATAIENAAPNNGDANNDGTADSQQSNVASFVDSQTGRYVSVVAPSSCTLEGITDNAASANGVADGAYSYPSGFIGYTADCGTNGYAATIKLYVYGSANGSVLRKYNPATHSYATVSGATITPVIVGGQSAQLITYQITDGSLLDSDGLANGVIVDPVGLGLPSTSSTTTAASDITLAAAHPTAPNTGLAGRPVFLPVAALVTGTVSVAFIVYRRLKIRETTT